MITLTKKQFTKALRSLILTNNNGNLADSEISKFYDTMSFTPETKAELKDGFVKKWKDAFSDKHILAPEGIMFEWFSSMLYKSEVERKESEDRNKELKDLLIKVIKNSKPIETDDGRKLVALDVGLLDEILVEIQP